jgi:hypothetical protein
LPSAAPVTPDFNPELSKQKPPFSRLQPIGPNLELLASNSKFGLSFFMLK